MKHSNQKVLDQRRAEKGTQGFSLLEIMIAIAILSVGLLAIYAAQGNSLRASGRAEHILQASYLAQQKMTEKIIDIRKEMKKGSFPDEGANDSGIFEIPFNNYRFEFSVRMVDIPVPDGGGAEKSEEGEQASNAGGPQRMVAQIVSKKIKETVRELTVKVLWEELGEDQFIQMTTHIARLK